MTHVQRNCLGNSSAKKKFGTLDKRLNTGQQCLLMVLKSQRAGLLRAGED